MRSRISERKHRAPRRPDEGRMPSGRADRYGFMQIRHVPLDAKALAAAASLKRFDDAVRLRQSARDRSHVAGRSRSAV